MHVAGYDASLTLRDEHALQEFAAALAIVELPMKMRSNIVSHWLENTRKPH
jgi:hypothetical protein